ncbi:transglycosylase [Polymorphobacter glacialis]|uniref:Transglycosylase n=1 Tax=Sandarakinorhabdus glacialis TaxID=1614636 RepID=A0A917E453_9SPHN|nr:lytic transglycosylase domain-containing protein [Polymorphobacter glacialis]GGE02963.1 transglycosylase [Polymorphobacter glacialis]
MIRAAIWVLAALAVPVFGSAPATAQVIEIGDDGVVTHFDGPMVFTASGAAPIEPPRVVPALASAPLEVRIDAQAVRHGLSPSLLRAVAWQESRGRAAAVSPKGALGVMQLMPGTAAAMGVDPRDPDDNLRGGALYLRRQLDRFGSVPLALAAYNAGPGAVARFGGVPPFRETRAYVASIMARWRPEAMLLGREPGSPSAVTPLLSFIEVPAL